MPAAVLLATVAIVLSIIGFTQQFDTPAVAAPVATPAPVICDGGQYRVTDRGAIVCLADDASRAGA